MILLIKCGVTFVAPFLYCKAWHAACAPPLPLFRWDVAVARAKTEREERERGERERREREREREVKVQKCVFSIPDRRAGSLLQSASGCETLS